MDEDIELTPVEREVSRLQGRELGPVVDDKPVRRMSGDELRRLLFLLTEQAEAAQSASQEREAAYIRRQASKVRKEIERRSRKRNGGGQAA